MNVFDAAAGKVRKLGPIGAVPAWVIATYGRGVTMTERAALTFLRGRLETVGRQPLALSAPTPNGGNAADPQHVLSTLLERGLAQNAKESRQEFYARILSGLVSDEARILEALANGLVAPSATVRRRSNNDVMLANASLVGRIAAVTLPSMTTSYANHLLAMGLIEIGPEDEDNEEGYELLLADKEVRGALKAGEFSKIPARVERATIRISDLGHRVWNAARPAEGATS